MTKDNKVTADIHSPPICVPPTPLPPTLSTHPIPPCFICIIPFAFSLSLPLSPGCDPLLQQPPSWNSLPPECFSPETGIIALKLPFFLLLTTLIPLYPFHCYTITNCYTTTPSLFLSILYYPELFLTFDA